MENQATKISELIYDLIESHIDFDGEIYANLGSNSLTLRDSDTNETYIISVEKEFN